MTHDPQNTQKIHQQGVKHRFLKSSYYTQLGVHPSATPLEIRRAYRELSKQYHPDITDLPPEMAKEQFQKLLEAYETLIHPQRRLSYDQSIGYSRFYVIQPPPGFNEPVVEFKKVSTSADLDPSERPLSPGEIFALFIMGLTLLGCLALAIGVGLWRGEILLS